MKIQTLCKGVEVLGLKLESRKLTTFIRIFWVCKSRGQMASKWQLKSSSLQKIKLAWELINKNESRKY